jgi:hypothetical protein
VSTSPGSCPLAACQQQRFHLGKFRLRAKKQNTRANCGTLSSAGFLIRHPAWPSEPCGTDWSTPSDEFHGILVASIRGWGRPILRFSDVSSNVPFSGRGIRPDLARRLDRDTSPTESGSAGVPASASLDGGLIGSVGKGDGFLGELAAQPGPIAFRALAPLAIHRQQCRSGDQQGQRSRFRHR